MIPEVNSIYARGNNKKLVTLVVKNPTGVSKVYYRQQGKGSHKEKYMTKTEWLLWVEQGAQKI